MNKNTPVGRFAPTPSGPLHYGSLLTALASWLSVKSRGGMWRLRMDDLDAPRCLPGADSRIQQQLEAHGLCWDGPVVRQSQHRALYADALARLHQQGVLYRCRCTRARLAVASHAGPGGPVYDGHCRALAHPAGSGALRLRLRAGPHGFHDALQGAVIRRAGEIGDFAVQRADGIVGYQLACALDESAMAITEVLRGSDLLASTLCQQAVMECLAQPAPRYLHLPVLVATDGRKLSKQNGATALDTHAVSQQLQTCLHWLGQSPPAALTGAPVSEWLAWALAHWNEATLPRQMTIAVA